MASSSSASGNRPAESEPLLGVAGDATQQEGSLLYNLFIGTGVIAQAGIWIFTAVVWGAILMAKPYMLVHVHPLLNSAGILLVTEAILLLQPTHTQSQKIQGTYYHAALNDLGIILLVAGLVVIEYNKGLDISNHFKSTHAYLGIVTYGLIVVQGLVGITMFFTPKLFGSVDNAKSLYKYHRMSGYLMLILLFVTVASATYTSFNSTLKVQLWAVVVSAVITLVGIIPRIKKRKLGL